MTAKFASAKAKQKENLKHRYLQTGEEMTTAEKGKLYFNAAHHHRRSSAHNAQKHIRLNRAEIGRETRA